MTPCTDCGRPVDAPSWFECGIDPRCDACADTWDLAWDEEDRLDFERMHSVASDNPGLK